MKINEIVYYSLITIVRSKTKYILTIFSISLSVIVFIFTITLVENLVHFEKDKYKSFDNNLLYMTGDIDSELFSDLGENLNTNNVAYSTKNTQVNIRNHFGKNIVLVGATNDFNKTKIPLFDFPSFEAVDIIEGTNINIENYYSEVAVIEEFGALAVFGTTKCVGESIIIFDSDYNERRFTVVGVIENSTDTELLMNNVMTELDNGVREENIYSEYRVYIPALIYFKDFVNNEVMYDYLVIEERDQVLSLDDLDIVVNHADTYFSNDIEYYNREIIDNLIYEKSISIRNMGQNIFYGSAFIATLGLINILLLSLNDRLSEFGMIRAMGARKGSIVLQVMFESFWISFFGSALSIIIFSTLMIVFGFSLELFGISQIYYYPIKEFIVVLITASFGGFFVGVIPSVIISRKNILKAMRSD